MQVQRIILCGRNPPGNVYTFPVNCTYTDIKHTQKHIIKNVG